MFTLHRGESKFFEFICVLPIFFISTRCTTGLAFVAFLLLLYQFFPAVFFISINNATINLTNHRARIGEIANRPLSVKTPQR
jgi:hypothetical protein